MLKEELPLRFAISLAKDTQALETYAHLSKNKKRALIKESMNIESAEEMDKFVNKIHRN